MSNAEKKKITNACRKEALRPSLMAFPKLFVHVARRQSKGDDQMRNNGIFP